MTDDISFFNKVFILVRGTLGASLISLISIPLITRLYSAEQIGTLGLLMSLVLFWSSFQTLRYDSAFFIAKTKSEIDYLVVICITCLLLITSLVIPTYYILVSNNILGFGILPNNYIIGAVLISLGLGGFLLFQNYNIRQSNFKLISRAVIIRSLGKELSKILFGYIFIPSVLWLVVGEVISAWSSVNAMGYTAVRKMGLSFKTFSKRKFMFVLKKHKMFPTIEMPSTAINKFNSIIPTPMVAYFFGPKEVGFFVLAQGIVSLPNSKVAKAIGDVFNMQFADYVRANKHFEARSLFYKTMKKLFLFGLFPLFGTLSFAPYLAGPILGQDWQEVGIYMAYFSPWLFCALLVSPLSRILSIYGVVKYKLYYDVLTLIFLVVLFGITEYLEFEIYEFIIAFVLIGIASYIVYGIILVQVIEKKVLTCR
ncbi:MAG: hypothetical protein K9G26_11880 [Emcibacter sp.]|nr:hypothetical protein [Emcibacter sp.]